MTTFVFSNYDFTKEILDSKSNTLLIQHSYIVPRRHEMGTFGLKYMP